jgi:hypothetical protein
MPTLCESKITFLSNFSQNTYSYKKLVYNMLKIIYLKKLSTLCLFKIYKEVGGGQNVWELMSKLLISFVRSEIYEP